MTLTPESTVTDFLGWIDRKDREGSPSVWLDRIESKAMTGDVELLKWLVQVHASYKHGLPGKRPEMAEGSAADLIKDALRQGHENRARSEQRARGLMHLPLEEVENLVAAEDEKKQAELLIHLRTAMREEHQELERSRAEKGAPAAPASGTHERESNAAPGGRLALPPALSPHEPEVASPEPAQGATGLDGWPKPEEMARLIRFSPERK